MLVRVWCPSTVPDMPHRPSSILRALLAGTALLLPTPLLAQSALHGTVVDSLAGGPLAGATVQLVRSDRPLQGLTAVTDAGGNFGFGALEPGRYVVVFFHPRLDSLGLQMPLRAVDVGVGETALALATPSAGTIAAATCGPPSADSTGLVLAQVRDADTGASLPGSAVRVSWSELVMGGGGLRSSRLMAEAVADDAGRVALCSIPTDVPVIASAELAGAASGPVELVVPPRGFVHRDLRIGRGTAAEVIATATDADDDSFVQRRGSARLVGTVRTADGRPVPHAGVMVHGTAAADTTGPNGTFVLNALPAGSYTLEARAIGWQPWRMAVNLASARTDTARVVLTQAVQALDRVTVYGKPSRGSRDLEGFLRRQHSGYGRYLGQEQIERRNAFDVTDLLRDVPSLRIVQGGESMFDKVILLRKCVPTVYLDGHEVRDGATSIRDMVTPIELAGIEVYNSPTSAPPELLPNYKKYDCGVVAFWTKWRMGT